MSKLFDLHLEAIEKSYHTVYRNMNEVEEVNNELAASKSAEITKDIAIEFARWCDDRALSDNYKTWGMLFEEFLKTKQ